MVDIVGVQKARPGLQTVADALQMSVSALSMKLSGRRALTDDEESKIFQLYNKEICNGYGGK
jgi:hypothetical protein